MDISVPDYCDKLIEDNIVSLHIPTNVSCNVQPVVFTYLIDITSCLMQLEVCGVDIDVETYGLSKKVTLDQMCVDSLLIITQSLRLCKGLAGNFPSDSSVPIAKHWNTIFGDKCYDEVSTHSH